MFLHVDEPATISSSHAATVLRTSYAKESGPHAVRWGISTRICRIAISIELGGEKLTCNADGLGRRAVIADDLRDVGPARANFDGAFAPLLHIARRRRGRARGVGNVDGQRNGALWCGLECLLEQVLEPGARFCMGRRSIIMLDSVGLEQVTIVRHCPNEMNMSAVILHAESLD